MVENRQHQRVDFEKRAWCEHARLTLYLPVTNVSRGGMFLQTGAAFLPGEKLRVAFDADGSEEPVVMEVEIVWTGRGARGSWGCGVRVVSFASGERQFMGLLRKRGVRA